MPRTKSTSQIWLEYIPVRVLFWILGVLPRRMALSVGESIGRLAYRMIGGLRRVAHRNLEVAFPDKTEEERHRVARASFESLGRVLGELTHFPKADRHQLESIIDFDFETDESRNSPELVAFEQERAKGRGVLLIGPHLGNWEIGVFAYSAFREPLTYLARPLDNPLIEDFTVRLRSRFGNRAINKNKSVTAAIAVLREGGVLGVLPDVNVLHRDGVFVPFLGTLACTTSGVAMMAMRTNAMILPMCCVWNPEIGKYRVHYGSLIEVPDTGDRHRDVLEATAAFTAEMEKFVRAYPEQWMWIHKRWKTRPDGEKELY
ncbi:MAG TPA: lysophospholipid acyltransferase family protein [Pyrinomonadaceae bacterium]|nr:lysophospholipid acyltransferase family protein [Pyrinomonadaceae bacterium]